MAGQHLSVVGADDSDLRISRRVHRISLSQPLDRVAEINGRRARALGLRVYLLVVGIVAMSRSAPESRTGIVAAFAPAWKIAMPAHAPHAVVEAELMAESSTVERLQR